MKNGELDLLAHFLIRIGHSADDHVELFALDDLACVARHLLVPEMRQKIVDIEHGVFGVLADSEFHLRAVLQHDDASGIAVH